MIFKDSYPSNNYTIVFKTLEETHLRGFLYRTLHLLQHDIWPVYVFDGACDAKERNQLSREELDDKHLAARKMHAEAIQDGPRPRSRHARGTA